MAMILLIDNYDSFVFNLARYVSELGFTYLVKRNQAISIDDIKALQPSHIIISPGPGAPKDAGISKAVIRNLGTTIPLLGVCLGHQAIAEVFGASIITAKRPMHGKSSFINHKEKDLFLQVKNPLQVARYHSLIVSEKDYPADLEITARCEIGEIMAIKHRQYPIWGVQFHPESVLTEEGYCILKNFFKLSAAFQE